MKEIAEIIRALREDADLDQADVARHLGIPQQTYSNYERGRYDLPIRHLMPLARLYHVNAEYLLGVTDYRASLEHLSRPYTSGVNIAELLSDLVALDKDGRRAALEYISFLKAKRETQ